MLSELLSFFSQLFESYKQVLATRDSALADCAQLGKKLAQSEKALADSHQARKEVHTPHEFLLECLLTYLQAEAAVRVMAAKHQRDVTAYVIFII